MRWAATSANERASFLPVNQFHDVLWSLVNTGTHKNRWTRSGLSAHLEVKNIPIPSVCQSSSPVPTAMLMLVVVAVVVIMTPIILSFGPIYQLRPKTIFCKNQAFLQVSTYHPVWQWNYLQTHVWQTKDEADNPQIQNVLSQSISLKKISHIKFIILPRFHIHSHRQAHVQSRWRSGEGQSLVEVSLT